jgi:hypothetical protein
MTKTREQIAAEYVERFGKLTPQRQETAANEIAERYSAAFANPKNIRAFAVGVRLGLLGESLPDRCAPHWRRGYGVGRAIRDGQVAP